MSGTRAALLPQDAAGANRRSPDGLPPAGWVEATCACLFLVAFGAGCAYITDPGRR